MAITSYENADFNNVIFLSAGTDGIDGPTPAAGAIGCDLVISDFLSNNAHNLSVVESVFQRSDSYNFYKNLKAGE